MHRTRKACVALVVATLALGSSVIGAGTATAAPDPTIFVTPHTDLVDGTSVVVTGADFNAGELLGVAQCTFGVCGTFGFVVADATGAFSTPFTINTTVAAVPSGSFSCLAVGCFIQVSRVTMGAPGVPWPYEVAALFFRNSSGTVDDRAIALSQSTALADTQTIGVTGTDFYTGFLDVRQCTEVPVLTCGAPVVVVTNPAGGFSTSLTVSKTFTGTVLSPTGTGGTATVDCSVAGSCFVVGSQGHLYSTEFVFDLEPLTFGKPVPVSRDECRNGGWRDLVDANQQPFKNQGACIAYVSAA
jgi:hypothetical protein